MGSACSIHKTRDTHSEYVLLIAFPLQQWSHKRSPMLRYSTLPVLFKNYLSGLPGMKHIPVIAISNWP